MSVTKLAIGEMGDLASILAANKEMAEALT